jgi:GAF domain-containing protein
MTGFPNLGRIDAKRWVVASRETLLARTFVDVSDTLVADFDVLDFLAVLAGRCVELLGMSEAGLMLADPQGILRVAASSSHAMNLLELFELQYDDGPCVDCFRTKAPVREDNLHDAVSRWPRFAPEAIAAGFASVYALPMRLRHQVIGSLNLLRVERRELDGDELQIAQALADVATIGILQHRAATESRHIAEQLQYALNSRIVIEQAKGVISAHAGLEMDDAFTTMRQYARNHNQRLADVAGAIAGGSLAVSTMLGSHDEA